MPMGTNSNLADKYINKSKTVSKTTGIQYLSHQKTPLIEQFINIWFIVFFLSLCVSSYIYFRLKKISSICQHAGREKPNM